MIRRFWRFILICADITNTYLGNSGPHHAAAITYYALFSLIPLTLAIMFILGTFVSGSDILEDRLSTAVNTLVPVSQDTLDDTLRVLDRTKAVAGSLGLIGLLWVSTTVFGAIRKGVNSIWGIVRPRRFFHEKLIDMSFTAGAGLLMVIPIALTAGIGVLGEAFSTLRTGSPDSQWLIGIVISPIISLTVFLFIYRYLPNTKVTFREVWPGALMTMACFEGWKQVFLWYTRSFPVFETVYGPVGALVALLTWIYISANILLVGALVTSRYSAYLSGQIEVAAHRVLSRLRPAPNLRPGVQAEARSPEAYPRAVETGEDD